MILRVFVFAMHVAAFALHPGWEGLLACQGETWKGRDPFRRISTDSDANSAPDEPGDSVQGALTLAHLRISQVVVLGIVATSDQAVALLQAPNGRTFLCVRGSRLLDGVVESISAEGIQVRRVERAAIGGQIEPIIQLRPKSGEQKR